MKERYSTLSNRDKRWLKQAVKLAKMSSCNQRHGAVITMGGRIVSVGINSERNSAHEANYEIDPGAFAVHAEVAALRALGGKAKGAKVYVARWMYKTNRTGLSRPCDNCYQTLIEAGVKEVIYT